MNESSNLCHLCTSDFMSFYLNDPWTLDEMLMLQWQPQPPMCHISILSGINCPLIATECHQSKGIIHNLGGGVSTDFCFGTFTPYLLGKMFHGFLTERTFFVKGCFDHLTSSCTATKMVIVSFLVCCCPNWIGNKIPENTSSEFACS